MKTLLYTKINFMFKNPIVKTISSAVAVAGFGFILLNFTFLLNFLLHNLISGLIKFFIPVNPETTYYWFSPMMHVLFMVVIGLISWPIFRSKLSVLYKAIYMTVPSAVILATIGMFLYRWPVIAYSLGSLLGIGVLYYFFCTRKPWLYYYSVILVGLVLTIFSLLGGEI